MAVIAAIVIFTFVTINWLHSEVKIGRMERTVEAARQQAKASDVKAAAAESAAHEYERKIEYLEGEFAAIGRIARRQDEELEKIGGDVGGARRDVERARSIRAIDATADELCAKLAELGHPC